MLLTQIKDDQLQARKKRHAELATFLTTLYAEAVRVGKDDGNRDTTDEEVCVVMKKFVKNAREVLESVPETDARFGNANFEIFILESYLPKQFTELELKNIIDTIIGENEITELRQMGTVMKHLKEQHTGLYDGKLASKLVKAAM